MQTVATHVALSVCLSVSLLVTTVSPTETAELVEVTFGSWTWVDLRNHVVGGDRNHPPPPQGRGSFGGHTWVNTDLPTVDILNFH